MHDRNLVDLYQAVGVPVDRLPYTPELRKICDQYESLTKQQITEHQIFWRLMTLRKRGDLPKLHRPN